MMLVTSPASAWSIIAAVLLSGAGCARPERAETDSVLARGDDGDAAAQRKAPDRAVTEGGPERTCTEQAPMPWEPVAHQSDRAGVTVHEVSRGPRGMASRLRWALSPDSSALLVVDDPAAVENEPALNSALYASERSPVMVALDQLWSVEPSPDWSRLAYGRGALLGGGAEQRVAPTRWDSVATSWHSLVGSERQLIGDSLRAHAFPASGMAVVDGVAATVVVDVGTTPTTKLAGYGGWRVRWSCDGGDLLLGDPPRRMQDDSPSEGEHRVSASAAPLTNAPAAPAVRWTEGPTLDVSVQVPRGRSTPLAVRGRVIAERNGRVVIQDRGAGGAAGTRDIGPGIPLAATRGGRYVLALAPRSNARPYESKDRAVIYRIIP